MRARFWEDKRADGSLSSRAWGFKGNSFDITDSIGIQNKGKRADFGGEVGCGLLARLVSSGLPEGQLQVIHPELRENVSGYDEFSGGASH